MQADSVGILPFFYLIKQMLVKSGSLFGDLFHAVVPGSHLKPGPGF
jgi:hypothetical protein